jgi:hypothetical protein
MLMIYYEIISYGEPRKMNHIMLNHTNFKKLVGGDISSDLIRASLVASRLIVRKSNHAFAGIAFAKISSFFSSSLGPCQSFSSWCFGTLATSHSTASSANDEWIHFLFC